MRRLRRCAWLGALLFTQGAVADDDRASKLQSIAESPAWLKLVHYQPEGRAGQRESSVVSADFFLATDGRRDPYQELVATLAVLRSPQGKPAARCRFPARALFLSAALNETFPAANCSDFDAYRQKNPLEGVSFVYAAGRLDHPASVFGHGFLRLNLAGEQSPILDPVLNFTAQTGDDSTLKYLAIGLVGGYQGKFSTPPYYELVERHNRRELRDLWEYPLSLSASQLELLQAHIWELRNAEFDYLFISDNCITQIVALLEAAIPSLDLMTFERGKVMPIQVLNGLSRHSELLGDPEHRASLIQKIDHREQFIDSTERRMIRRLAGGKAAVESISAFSPSRQAAILDMAHDLAIYQQFEAGEVERSNPVAAKLLATRAALDERVKWPAVPTPSRQPASAHGSARGRVGLADVNGRQSIQLGWRFVYHDLLDPVAANPWGTEVEAWNFLLDVADDKIRLKQLDIVNIANYARRGSLLRQPSFRTQIGIRPTLGRQKSEFAIDRATGVTWGREPWFAYAMLQTDIAAGSAISKGWRLGGGVRAGVYLNPMEKWAVHLYSVSTVGIAGDNDLLAQWQLEQQWSPSQHLGIRLSIGEQLRRDDKLTSQRDDFAELSFLSYW